RQVADNDLLPALRRAANNVLLDGGERGEEVQVDLEPRSGDGNGPANAGGDLDREAGIGPGEVVAFVVLVHRVAGVDLHEDVETVPVPARGTDVRQAQADREQLAAAVGRDAGVEERRAGRAGQRQQQVIDTATGVAGQVPLHPEGGGRGPAAV